MHIQWNNYVAIPSCDKKQSYLLHVLQSQEVLDYNPPEPYAAIEQSKPTTLGTSHPPGRQASASVSGPRPAIPARTLPTPSTQTQPEPVVSPTGRMTNRVPTYYSLKLSRKTAQKHLSPRELARNQAQQNAANNGGNGAPVMNEADKLFAYVVREIINTEQDYLNDLKLIVDVSTPSQTFSKFPN